MQCMAGSVLDAARAPPSTCRDTPANTPTLRVKSAFTRAFVCSCSCAMTGLTLLSSPVGCNVTPLDCAAATGRRASDLLSTLTPAAISPDAGDPPRRVCSGTSFIGCAARVIFGERTRSRIRALAPARVAARTRSRNGRRECCHEARTPRTMAGNRYHLPMKTSITTCRHTLRSAARRKSPVPVGSVAWRPCRRLKSCPRTARRIVPQDHGIEAQ